MEGFSISYILFPIAAFMGFLLRRLFVKLEKIMTEEEIRRLLRDKMVPLEIKHDTQRHEIKRLESKMEKELVQINRKLDDIWNFVVNGKK